MHLTIAADLVTVCHRLYQKGLVVATDGNVTTRLPSGNILATRSGVSMGAVDRKDLVEVTASGEKVSGQGDASTELKMHLFIYSRAPDVGAVVHAHPPYATAFAVARVPLDAPVLPEVLVGLGGIPLAPYATPSTDEVSSSIAPFIRDHSAILLSNHGVVTLGSTLNDAFLKMEKAEHAAHVIFHARMLGGEKALTADELGRLRVVAANIYRKKVPDFK